MVTRIQKENTISTPISVQNITTLANTEFEVDYSYLSLQEHLYKHKLPLFLEENKNVFVQVEESMSQNRFSGPLRAFVSITDYDLFYSPNFTQRDRGGYGNVIDFKEVDSIDMFCKNFEFNMKDGSTISFRGNHLEHFFLSEAWESYNNKKESKPQIKKESKPPQKSRPPLRPVLSFTNLRSIMEVPEAMKENDSIVVLDFCYAIQSEQPLASDAKPFPREIHKFIAMTYDDAKQTLQEFAEYRINR